MRKSKPKIAVHWKIWRTTHPGNRWRRTGRNETY